MSDMDELAVRLGLREAEDKRTPAERAYDERVEAELAARGEPFGLDPREVRAADRFGQTPEDYAAWKDVRTIDDFERVRADRRVREQARQRAAFEDDVARRRVVRR